MADEKCIINIGKHAQDDGKTSRPGAVSTLHNAIADHGCPLVTADAVKHEPPDVKDFICSTDIANVNNYASNALDEDYYIEMDTAAVKNELLDDLCSQDCVGKVKNECCDVWDEVCLVDTAAMVKQEVYIGPAVLQPPDIMYTILPCKSDPDINVSQMDSNRLSRDNVNVALKQDLSEMPGMYGVRYVCNICSKSFTLESSFQGHLLTHSDEDNCDITNTEKNISIHTSKTSHSYDNVSPNMVEKVMKSHKVTDIDGRLHRCDICSKTLSTKGNLKHHKLSHTGETHCDGRRYSCDICRKTFSRKGNLKQHVLAHTGERSHRCAICKKTFTQQGNLKTHMVTHTGERPYHCDICNKNFSHQGSLKLHMLTHTGERPYCCDVCNKTFSQQGHFKSHMFTHTGERPYQCDICNKNFSQQGTLKSHMFSHTGERPYNCDLCNKKFSQQAHLKAHCQTHTGERPYHCDICNKNFSQQRNFKAHMFTHSDERPYHCHICNKNYSQKANLKYHMFTHTGEGPYHCDILCNKNYLQESRLKTHMFTHTGESPYHCDICNKNFSQQGNL